MWYLATRRREAGGFDNADRQSIDEWHAVNIGCVYDNANKVQLWI